MKKSYVLVESVVKDEEDITLGIDGIFDAFDITFKKSQNRIILKKASKIGKLLFK